MPAGCCFLNFLLWIEDACGTCELGGHSKAAVDRPPERDLVFLGFPSLGGISLA